MGDVPAEEVRRPGVFRWLVWRQPRRVIWLVVGIHVAAAASVLGTAWMFSVYRHHWLVAAVLIGLGIVQLEISRSIGPPAPGDRAVPYSDLKTVWNVAATLLLPPLLATVVVIVSHAYGFLRIYRRPGEPIYRWAYSCSTVVLATQAAALVLDAGTAPYPGVPAPAEFREWLVVFAAVSVRWLVNYLLVIVAGRLARPRMSFKNVFARVGDQAGEAAATGLAIVVAVLLEHGYLVLLVCVYLVVAVLQQTSYYHYWKRERPYDALTGVYSRMSFVEQAERVLGRAKIGGETVGCLLLDLDFFKRINDTHGHNVGDQALVAVAGALKQEVREGKDIPARWGGEEFVVLLPGVTAGTLHEIAERVRRRVSGTEVTYRTKDPATGATTTHTVTMTVSIGAALFPDPTGDTTEESLLDLVERADRLMYAAKAAGRDQVRSVHGDQQAGVPFSGC
jgi:diguanylate cyclase (GGDEF)-like protein